MAKPKLSETGQDEPEETRETAQDATLESSGSEPHSDAVIRSIIDELAVRLARVERMAHGEHAITPEAIGHITEHVMEHVKEHLRTSFRHSGLPVRGDQA